MKPIKTLLADDHTVVREGLRALLSTDSGILVVGEAHNGREAVERAVALRPDVIVMDIAMPLLNGLEATRQILASVPGTKVLILSAHSDDAYIDRVIAVGAVGFLIKQTSAQILAKAIHEVMSGKTLEELKDPRRARFPRRNGTCVRDFRQLHASSFNHCSKVVSLHPATVSSRNCITI